jgi:signal transduction histidine kinase
MQRDLTSTLPPADALALDEAGAAGVVVPGQAGVRQRDALIHAVAEAARHLLADSDFDRGVTAALTVLGQALGAPRIGLVEDLPVPGDQRPGRWRGTHEWHRPDLKPQLGSPTESGDYPSWAWWQRLCSDEVVVLPNEIDPPGERQSQSILAVLVPGPTRRWVAIGYLVHSSWSPQEISILQTAAACVGAAIERRDAEAQRLALERSRTEQAQSLNRLLEGVVQASKALLDGGDFSQSMPRWLALLADAMGADAAMLGRYGASSGDTLFEAYWSRDGSPRGGIDVPSTRDFDAWTLRLQAGELVWAHRDELLDAASVDFWQRTDCWTNLLVPVTAGARALGWLGFDWRERREWNPAFASVLRAATDSLAAALQREQAQQALAAEREHRLALQQARADEAARQTRRIERHSALLAAVAVSAEELLAAREPALRLDAVLQRVGELTQAQRAAVSRVHWTPGDPQRHGWQEIAHEWTAPGAVRQMDQASQRFEMRRDDATWGLAIAQFATQRHLFAVIDELDEPFRSEQLALGAVWSLCYPILVEGEIWGLLGVDFGTPFEGRDEAHTAALQTVASTIAAALRRQQLEQRAVASERERADENAHLVGLLEVVVRSSRTLFDAADFEPALRRWLGEFGHATAAMRATFYDITTHAPSGRPTTRMLCEWVREGVENSVAVTFDEPLVIDPRGAEAEMARLLSGQVVAVLAADLEGPMRDFMASQGNAMVLAVPVFMDGRQSGCLSFDYAEQRAFSVADVAVLQTAADTLAAILKRNQSARAALAEREARLALEQRRFSELAQANAALRLSLDALADAQGEQGFLRQTLLQIHAQAGAARAYLFSSDEPGAGLRLLGCVAEGSFRRDGFADDPPMFRQGFTMVPSLLADLVAHGRLLWRRVDPQAADDPQAPESLRWHARMGHRANALHALMIGPRQVGLIGMVFDSDTPPSEARQELIHTLCQPLTLALELARLAGESRLNAERAAVLGERERMAAEIHDSLAQSFTSIAMQSESLARRLGSDSEHGSVLRLIERTAREGLAEARTSVLALQPVDGAPGALDGALAELARRSTVEGGVQCRCETRGAPFALPGAVRETLLRIAQEATSNAMRHAQGTQVLIRLDYVQPGLRLSVEDDGRGMPAPDGTRHNGGFGMPGMASRAAAIGGRLDVAASPLGGVAVRVEVADVGAAGPAA